MQYMLAGIRSTVGLKAGRYMFETRIIEKRGPGADQSRGKGKGKDRDRDHGEGPEPRQMMRIGLSVAGSSVFMGSSEDNCCFDIDGFFLHGKKKQKLQSTLKIGTLAVLVNQEASGPNANTISIFKNGSRACKPIEIPEKLKGKTLYPTITYRNVTFEANFGPVAFKPLPFKCTTLKEAAAADVVVTAVNEPKDGKYEVLFPVCLPGRGLFDWLDDFLEKNPTYTELSDRKILEWARQSGIWAPKNDQSYDKPSMQFGLPLMDDLSVRRVLQAVAPTQKRNFVIGELKANLVKRERELSLGVWSGRHFKSSAAVIMGEPPKEFKDKVQANLLKDKTTKAENERKKKVSEVQRKKLAELKKNKAEAAKAKRNKKEGDEEPEPAEEEDIDVAAAAEAEVEPINVELTEEEKKMSIRKRPLPDIAEKFLAKAYANFALPEKDEGFGDIKYVWAKAPAAEEELKKYILEHKLTQKVEDLKIGEFFTERSKAWTTQLQAWKKAQQDWKDPAKKKAMLAKKLEDKKAAGDEDASIPEIDVESLDCPGVEDVADVGSGEPLFSKFAYEDWTLVSIRYELHLMIHSFKKDLDDPDRPSFPEAHLGFYYNKYWKKQWSLSSFASRSSRNSLTSSRTP